MIKEQIQVVWGLIQFAPIITESLERKIINKIVRPTLNELNRRKKSLQVFCM